MAIDPKLNAAFSRFGYNPALAPTPLTEEEIAFNALPKAPAELTHAKPAPGTPVVTGKDASLDAVEKVKAIPLDDPLPPPVLNQPAPAPVAPAQPRGPVLVGEQRSSKVAHPEFLKAAKELEETADAAAKASQAQTNLNIQKANDEMRLQQSTQKEADRLTAENEAEKLHRQADVDRGKAVLDDISRQYANHKITDYFEGRPGTQLLAALAAGFGAWGASINGGENTALRIIDSNIARDRAKQLNEQEKLLGMKQEARGDLKDLQARLLMADTELRAKHDALYTQMERRRVAELAKYGANQAQIDGDKTLVGIRERKAQNKADMYKGLETIVTRSYATPTPANTNGVSANQDNVIYGQDGQPIAVLPQTGEAGKKNAELANRILAAQRKMEANAAKLDELLAQGKTLPSSERSKRMQGLQRQMTLDLKELKTMGALDKGAIEVSEDMIPKDVSSNWTGLGSSGRAVLKDFMDGLAQETGGRLSSLGINGAAVLQNQGLGRFGQAQGDKLTPMAEAKLRQEYNNTTDPGRRAAIARTLKAGR